MFRVTYHTHSLHQSRLCVSDEDKYIGVQTELVNPAVDVWRYVNAWAVTQVSSHRCQSHSCHTDVTLLSHCYHTGVTQMTQVSHSYHTAVTVLSHSCHACYTSITQLSHSLPTQESFPTPKCIVSHTATVDNAVIYLSTRTTSSLSSEHKSFGQQMRISVFGSSRTLLRAEARSLID